MMAPRGARRVDPAWLAVALAPVAVAVAGYARSLHGEFQFDDLRWIVGSPALKAFGPWARGLLLRPTVDARPLTDLTLAANYALGRLDPFGYHLVNVALHLCVVLLVGRLTHRVASLAGAARPAWIAAAVAGLFAVHPLQSQAVSYVSQRAETLASALYVATLLILLREAPADGRRRWGRWLAALATFLLGLAAKPIVLTLPAAFLAITAAFAPGATPDATAVRRRAAPPLVAMAIAGTAFAVALLGALRGRADAGFGVAGTSPWLYFLTQLRACVVYLRLLAWPSGQRVDWRFPTSAGIGEPATLAAAAAVLAIAVGAALLLLRGRGRATPGGAAARLAGLGLAWFLVVPAVTSSVVPLVDNLVEHRIYLASWGIFLAAVAAADAIAARRGLRRSAVVAYLAVLLVLGVALHRRNAVWQTQEALWRDVLEKDPASPRAHLSLGHAYEERQRTEEAIREYLLALPLAASDPWLRVQILRNLGGAQLAAGRPDDARRALDEGLRLAPADDELLVNAAFVAAATGDPAAAERLARRALEVRPGQAVAWVVLGNLALERQDWPGALADYDRAAALDPDGGDALYNRSLALRMMGRQAEACAAIGAALEARLLPGNRATAEADLASRCRTHLPP